LEVAGRVLEVVGEEHSQEWLCHKKSKEVDSDHSRTGRMDEISFGLSD
jgi:hypothetical protein